MKKRTREVFVFLVYAIFGIYFLNLSLNFLNIPEKVFEFNSWIYLVGGILILLGGFEYLRAAKHKKALLLSKQVGK